MKALFSKLKDLFSGPFIGGRKKASLPFAEVFSLFRSVLSGNNRALELIADMGEKLGGEYLFDIVYVRSAYEELVYQVLGSMHSFDKLTGNTYVKLMPAFQGIDNRIKNMLEGEKRTQAERVVFLEDITWDMSREVGGKNANLAELKNYLKLNVPDGFAVTTHAFDEFMKHNNVARRQEWPAFRADSTVDEEKAASLMRFIAEAELPFETALALEKAVEKITDRCGGRGSLAVRSSAEDEDGSFSFAGQFETLLNVPLDVDLVKKACLQVIASLFSAHALDYQARLGYKPGDLKMAICCILMIDAETAGVLYSTSPGGDRDTQLINGTWGLGEAVVEGKTDADLYIVNKKADSGVVELRMGSKEFMVVAKNDGGVEKVETPGELRSRPCLTPARITELSGLSTLIEKHFRKPQDIEWAIDKNGKIYVLQSRPIRTAEDNYKKQAGTNVPETAAVLMRDKGIIVQSGSGGGRVFVIKDGDSLERFPKGAVLVAAHDSSRFVRLLPYASAVITSVGSPTSHMASLCREFGVPAVVNAGEAVKTLQHGQLITLRAAGNGEMEVYDGIVENLIQQENYRPMEDLYEYRMKRYVLRYISPLNLIDPLTDDFRPESCRTVHDILRFMHEKAMSGLVESAGSSGPGHDVKAAVKLDLPVPAGIMVIDIGGGLKKSDGRAHLKSDHAVLEEVISVPLRAIIRGMLHPGAWRSDMVSLDAKDFLAGMTRMPDIFFDKQQYPARNVAVASGDYVNLSLRFGYHFTILDSYCGDIARNNHVYFRFAGGATDMAKRSRRVRLISGILRHYGFGLTSKGDLVIGRLANLPKEEIEGILENLGRLTAYTRQLDAAMRDDASVDRLMQGFLEETYDEVTG